MVQWFDKDTKEAYILQPHSISVIDSDQAAAAAAAKGL
jgi:hypothetical protein